MPDDGAWPELAYAHRFHQPGVGLLHPDAPCRDDVGVVRGLALDREVFAECEPSNLAQLLQSSKAFGGNSFEESYSRQKVLHCVPSPDVVTTVSAESL